MKIFLLSFVALCCFAANSLLARYALVDVSIDAWSYSSLRITSGALFLGLLLAVRRRSPQQAQLKRFWPAFWLAIYTVGFSIAYLNLTAATGALTAFGCVQISMWLGGWIRGERPGIGECVGLVLASAGLIYLLLPGLEAPPLVSACWMALAGVGWGAYSLLGKGSVDPVRDTAMNFVYASPVIVLLAIVIPQSYVWSVEGVALAVISGAVTSGGGYVLWYAALRGLTASRAALLQLSVPVLTALVGALLLAEPLGVRWFIASGLVLGGVATAILMGQIEANRIRQEARDGAVG